MKRHSAPRRATKADSNIANLMFELGRVRGEEDIRGVLQSLLRVAEAGLYRLEVAAGRGFADMVCHEYRVVIETKSRGECNPRAPGSRASENQEQQLGRYLSAMADSAPASGSGPFVPWQGFLTDGEAWWGYQWNEAKMCYGADAYRAGLAR